jgi:hypothetical protein
MIESSAPQIYEDLLVLAAPFRLTVARLSGRARDTILSTPFRGPINSAVFCGRLLWVRVVPYHRNPVQRSDSKED